MKKKTNQINFYSKVYFEKKKYRKKYIKSIVKYKIEKTKKQFL